MIFVTAGTQQSFDRLIEAVDKIAPKTDDEIVVQAIPGCYIPFNLRLNSFIEPTKYSEIFEKADIVITHAGMGTIIKALEIGKPLIVFPRIARLGEHRNDHQIATIKHLSGIDSIKTAWNVDELWNILSKRDQLINESKKIFIDFAPITAFIKEFIDS